MTTTSLPNKPPQQQHQQPHPNYPTDIIDDNTGIQFDDLAQSRGRTTRAASLALDKDQTFLNPSHLIQSSRRHSSHYCPPTLTESNLILQNIQNQQQQQKHQQQQQQQSNSQPNQNIISSSTTTFNPTVLITTQNSSPKHHQQQQQHQQICSIVPPPVPKRTFQGKQHHRDNPAYRTRLNSAQPAQNQAAINFCNQRRQRRYSENSDENDDNFSLSPLSLDDKDKLDDIIIYDRSNPGLIKSGQSSSSDSNKSQTTIDTGYMSSSINDIDRQPIFTIGQRDTPVFRNRFSSEDTQSSMDSYMSSDYPNNSEILDSPQNKYDSVFILPNNNCTNQGGLNNNNSSSNNNHGTGSMKTRKYVKNTNESIDGALGRRLPVVPVRKQITVPPKLPPPIIKQTSANSIRSRGTSTSSNSSTAPPPPPPLRSQASLDSGKLFQNGHMLGGAFQTSTYSSTGTSPNKENNLQEMHNRPPMPIKKGIHGAHKPPPLTQVHHTKINQRQDSNISSDSCSFASSSPGYNSKSMEVPLLQYAPKINNKTGIRHQDSNDSFNMITRNGMCVNGSGASTGIGSSGKKINVRQDSNISSDSQTSSPGYNTKLMEAPLLAHACKLPSSKFSFISFL